MNTGRTLQFASEKSTVLRQILKSITSFNYYLDMRYYVAGHLVNTFLVFRVIAECAPLMIGGNDNKVLQVLECQLACLYSAFDKLLVCTKDPE